ncbi:hypothetical protein ACNOYE_13375 [Nannocystaceae bacterium ST9]
MELEQLEALALAPDRSEALAQLIPGTEEYYFHHCLEHLHRGEFELTKPLFDAWVKRHGETSRVRELRDRHALLALTSEPSKSREYLRRRLGLTFDHQREIEGTRSDLPTRLDPSAIDREAFFRDAVAHRDDLGGFTARANEWLVERELSPTQLRALLSRLTRPDYPDLVALVIRELDDKRSSGFGSLNLHRLLLPEQLDALAAARPALLDNPAFVETRLARLRPGPDVDLDNDGAAMLAWLDALAGFVEPLAAAFAGLQVHVLYHRLDFDRRRGVYDRARFERYLALPRQANYLASSFQRKHRDALARVEQDFTGATGLANVHDDEPLVRDYLAQIFATLDDHAAFRSLIDEDWLRRVFAETKILAGLGDAERWYSLLDDPTYYQQLEQRVDIELAVQNPRSFAAGDPVVLQVDVKNVQTLVVKVFEIDTLAYFTAHGRAVDTSVDLDGLVANDERILEFGEPALRRVRRELRFDALDRAGTYVIELIGKGKSSRALIRKGGLRYVERLGAAGHVLTILDEDDRRVPEASVWFAGREYRPDDAGEIRIPYAGAASTTEILLRAGRVASIVPFSLKTEHYGLHVGFHVEREQLIAGANAELVVRASLTLHGVAIPISLLREITLTIASTDRHATSSSMSAAIELRGEAEAVHTFKVPDALSSLSFTLRGKVRSVTGQRDVELSARDALTINEIDLGEATAALHLAASADGYVLSLLGKTGEPRADMQVNVTVEHLDFTARRQAALQTDARGRIELGPLTDIAAIDAGFGGGRGRWVLVRSDASTPSRIHVSCDRPLILAQPYPLGDDPVAAIALLEQRGTGYVRDCIDKVALEPGGVRIGGLTPGDYVLWFKHEGRPIHLSVGPATVEAGFALSPRRHLQLSRAEALRITATELDDRHLRVRVAGAGDKTRVHVFASRFLPASDPRNQLDHRTPNPPSVVTVGRARSHYLSGRDIGDEYRYILERRRAKRFAGNMAERPSLLLNPWAIRTTSSGTQDARDGSMYAAEAEERMRSAMAPAQARKPTVEAAGGSVNLDFLAAPAFVALGLIPDDEGWVTIDRAALAHAQLVRIVACDPLALVSRQLALPELDLPSRDLRLHDALPVAGHFIQRKQAAPLGPGDALVIEDVRTSKLETVDTLAKAHALLETLSGDASLREFEFVTRWPSLSLADKRERYSKYACHELHLFLARKDPAFFAEVVRPYLADKRDKTFMDHYLLGGDLAGWREPWAFGRLNTLERILLLGRAGARHVGDRCDLIPPDVAGDNASFDVALQGSALATESLATLARSEAGPGGGGLARQFAVGGSASFGGMPAPPPMAAPAPAAPPRGAPAPKRAKLADKMAEEKKEIAASYDLAEMDDEYADADLGAREQQRRFYQSVDKTEEWAENNYYRRRIHEQGPELIRVNAFWREFAEHDPGAPFLSRHFVRATSCLAEMLCALAVLDLPFEATPPITEFEQARLTLRAATPLLVFSKQIAAVEPDERGIGVLVSQNYFRSDDRYRYENDERHDKYVGDELLVHVVYVCRIVLTNPSSSYHKLDLLVQIPRGALPVAGGFETRDLHVQLAPHGTEALEYSFYFPAPGEFDHFPVHVAKHERLVVHAAPTTLKVVTTLSRIDIESWSHVSQHAGDVELLAWLEANNLDRLDLGRIAWRMRERGLFVGVLALLERRHVYADVLWSYALHHFSQRPTPEIVAALGVYLRHQDGLLRGAGLALDSAIVACEPVSRRWYEHLEYAPLVNARAHQLGAKRTILNHAFADHYRGYLTTLLYVAAASDDQLVEAAGYALLQDRVDDALALLARVAPERVTGQLQLDYLRAHLAISQEDPRRARELAERHREHPVDRWRRRFANLLAILAEAEGAGAQVVDPDDRQQEQGRLASIEANFEFAVEGSVITLDHQNLRECTVRYYRMDIELLFSRQPFMQDQSARFSIVQPNHEQRLELAGERGSLRFELPAEYRSSNTIIEVVGAGIRRSQANYAHDLGVRVIEQYGQLRVGERSSGQPLARAYVKVYARTHDGAVAFYKDGYTDLRGAFDYASLSTDTLDRVQRFAILVMTDDRGALIREAAPPQR